MRMKFKIGEKVRAFAPSNHEPYPDEVGVIVGINRGGPLSSAWLGKYGGAWDLVIKFSKGNFLARFEYVVSMENGLTRLLEIKNECDAVEKA